MSHRMLTGLATLCLALAPALAELGPGDKAPALEVKESFNVSRLDLKGKLVLYEVFRTW